MIVLHATLRAVPGRRDDLARALDAVRVEARDEPGTLVYAVHTVEGDPDAVCCYEIYRDADAQAAHFENAALRELIRAFPDLLSGPPEVDTMDLVGANGLVVA